MTEGGINDANIILRNYHKNAASEANKAKEIESDVIDQLSGLRADLAQKIKEIKSLSGDFKNSVDKEKEGTRKAVNALHESLAAVDSDPHGAVGKEDPFVIKLGVDRQVERQIDEENYLHRVRGSNSHYTEILTGYRRISTWRDQGASSNPLSWEKFRKRTTHWLAFLNARRMRAMKRLISYVLDRSLCQRIMSGSSL